MACTKQEMATVVVGILCLLFLSQVYSFPASRTDRSTDKLLSCKVNVTRTFNESKKTLVGYNYTAFPIVPIFKTEIVEVNVTTEDCCEGWAGDNCDIPLTNVSEDKSPCGNATCSAYPKAHCALVHYCGEYFPLFLDASSLVIEECVPDNLCLGICRQDPCEGLKCDLYPEALCFTDGCKCEPMWRMPGSKQRVSCGNALDKKDNIDVS